MRLIDADALMSELTTMYKSPTSAMTLGYDHAIADVVVTVHEQPTADVVGKERYDRLLENANILADAVRKYQTADLVERKVGRWKGEGLGDYRCSLCGEVTRHTRTNYCPNCGAEMVKGEEDDTE